MYTYDNTRKRDWHKRYRVCSDATPKDSRHVAKANQYDAFRRSVRIEHYQQQAEKGERLQ